MNQDMHQKVKATHLKRNAYLYIRQSTLRQVFENVESTKRQYALRQRAIALGWQQELARSRNRRSRSEADDPFARGGCHDASKRTDHTACALSWWCCKNGC